MWGPWQHLHIARKLYKIFQIERNIYDETNIEIHWGILHYALGKDLGRPNDSDGGSER